MNLQYKIWMAIFALGAILGSCDSLIYDDLKDCPQGVYVKFYSMTPCGVDSLYPAGIRNLNVYAFNENDILVAQQQVSNVTLSSQYKMLIPLIGKGAFTFIGWANVDNSYQFWDVKEGVTTKRDLLLKLNQTADLTDKKLYMGEGQAVSLPDPAEMGSYYGYSAVNLLEITNRIKVILQGVPHASDFSAEIVSRNGSYQLNGAMPLNSDLINYPSHESVDAADTILTANFTTLKLQTGYDSELVLKSKTIGNELYHGDLLGTLLLRNPQVNLECDHDFVIKFVYTDKCHCGTHVVTDIFVNDWLVHSYETGLE